jgi:hypothetical protein
LLIAVSDTEPKPPKPPFVDVESIRDRLVAFYDEAPYKETAQAFVQGSQDVLAALSDVFATGMEMPGIEANAKALGVRLEWYSDALEGADSDDDIVAFVLDPLLDGEYPEELDEAAPDWPEAETVWRLMNQITGAIGNQVAPDMREEAYGALREAYEDAFRLFWTTVATELDRMVEQVPEGFSEQMVDDIREGAAQARALADEPATYVIEPTAPSGTGTLALGVLGIGALLLVASRRRR